MAPGIDISNNPEAKFLAIRDNDGGMSGETGVGMSDEIIEKVRSGMFFTKGSKGTGLGLLVIQKVISEHKGSLEIESKEEERARSPCAARRRCMVFTGLWPSMTR